MNFLLLLELQNNKFSFVCLTNKPLLLFEISLNSETHKLLSMHKSDIFAIFTFLQDENSRGGCKIFLMTKSAQTLFDSGIFAALKLSNIL